MAAALLDWERRHVVPPVPEPSPGSRRLPDAAADLVDHPAGTWPRTFDLDGIARRPELRTALDGIALDERSIDDLSTFALAAHVAADDFITLHMVTGARAVRNVSTWLDEDATLRLAAHTVPVMAIAYAAAGAPPLPTPEALDALRRSSLASRSRIAERAVDDHDPHVVKLADVALAEEARTGDPLYRYVAGRVVGLTEPVAALAAT